MAALLLLACGDSHGGDNDGDGKAPNENAGAGSTLSVSGAGGAGTTGANAGSAGTRSPTGNAGSSSAGSGSAAATCREWEQQAATAVADTLERADLSCGGDADCKLISIDSDCHFACGALVGRAGEASVKVAIDAENDSVCADFERAGCKALIPPCEPPQPFACVEGTCRFQDGSEPPIDAGASDASTTDASTPPGPGCFEGTITWGYDGGFVAWRDRYTLESCRDFSAVRMGVRTEPLESTECMNEVAASAAISVDDVEQALKHPHVITALDVKESFYGRDSRPVDGVILRVERNGSVIDIGDACPNGTGGCTPIPLGIQALREVLLNLAEQQRAIPNCDQLQP